MKSRDAYERCFYPLLDDSTELAKLAVSYELTDCLARSSAILSLLLIETAANCCIDALALEGASYAEIDRLPVAAKFDLFLRVRFRRKLDRSRHEYSILRELGSLRDSVAHPKVSKIVWYESGPDEGEAVPDQTKVLGIAERMQDWQVADALSIMRGVHRFLGFFFRDQCRLKPKAVTAILFSEEKTPDVKTPSIVPGLTREDAEFYQKWNIDISYIRWS